MMATREETVRRSELLEDSRSTLRQVEEILGELGIRGLRNHSRPASSLAELLDVMVRARREILDVVESLQRSRGVIQKASLKRLQNSHLKLREVSATTTERAAVDMLDGLDRSLDLVDRLEARGAAHSGPDDDGVADDLRDELHSLISLLQFQDITSQQLAYASGVLVDVEERLACAPSGRPPPFPPSPRPCTQAPATIPSRAQRRGQFPAPRPAMAGPGQTPLRPHPAPKMAAPSTMRRSRGALRTWNSSPRGGRRSSRGPNW
jgi:hypothetical protein